MTLRGAAKTLGAFAACLMRGAMLRNRAALEAWQARRFTSLTFFF